jgi:hypothetical protein
MTTFRSEPTDLVVIEPGETSPGLLTDAELDGFISEAITGLVTSWRHSLEHGWRLGQLLAEKKRRLPYGAWRAYVARDLPFQKSQAHNLISLGEADVQFLGQLPAGTTVTEATRLWQRSRRPPRPTPLQDGVPDGEGGIDGEAPRTTLLRFNPPLTLFPDASTVLDTCYGFGNFWSGSSPYRVVGHDIDAERAPDGVMDCTDLQYEDASFDVVVFDPPHLADGGEESEMTGRFGTVKDQAALDNLIIEGTREAWRCCRLGMIVKVTNHVHALTFQNEAALVDEALDWKIDLYDQVYQTRDHAFIDPSWGEQCSAYNNGAVYLVYRKGDQRHVPRRRP